MELNRQYIGSYIKFMRQRAGLTQCELAGRIGVSSKAISKWEQGRGIPDISLLYSLSLELDVDIESILAGNLDDIGREWIGMIRVDESGDSNIGVWEWECMISMFLLVGMRSIVILCENRDSEKPEKLLKAYCDRGFLREMYCINSINELKQSIDTDKRHVCLLYQPAFLYGMNLTRYMRRAMLGGKIKVLSLRQGKNSFMPAIRFNKDSSCISSGRVIDSEWHMFPMLFGHGKSITDYLEQIQGRKNIDTDQAILSEFFSTVYVEAMERGMLAFSFRTKRDREMAKQVLQGIETSQDIRIGSLEEIMGVRGWI